LAELEAAPDTAGVFAAFERTIRPYGYTSVDYASGPIAGWPMRDNLEWRPEVVYATFDWSDVYFGTDFQKHDRMLPHMLRQTSPWLYWDVWGTPTSDPVAQELDRRAQARVRSGLSIPLHGPGLCFAGVNLGSDLGRDDLERRDQETRAEVFLLACTLHDHLRRRAGGRPAASGLSERQRECLTWAARGKTAWETATILSISESSVRKHLAIAAQRLDARTSIHAVAVALSTGMIRR
jgi:LuxR family quorum sensing-dependent transcriptional regulator